MLRLTKLLVPPDLLSSKTAPCKRMNWACFWSSGCRTSRCSLYFWMSPNLPAEFFCKPPLPFVGKGCLHCILQVPLSASVYFPVSWMWQCCGLSWKQLPSLGPAPNLSFPFARDQGWNEKLHSYHPANAQENTAVLLLLYVQGCKSILFALASLCVSSMVLENNMHYLPGSIW